MKASDILCAVGLLSTIHSLSAFTIHRKDFNSRILNVATANIGTELSVPDIKNEIDNQIQSTQRGLSASPQQQATIDELIQSLEKKCPIKEPARSPLMGGNWVVEYTTAPPPSNGKLGPFCGVARQVIDLEGRTYINYLSVPGDIKKEWLSASLEATFEEWDGEFLPVENNDKTIKGDIQQVGNTSLNVERSKDQSNWLESLGSMFKGNNAKSKSNSNGANSWKVNFKTLTIKVFGFQVIQKKFDEGTSRIWQMTYLDEAGTRIVRAGRTGKEEDNVLFYMKRED